MTILNSNLMKRLLAVLASLPLLISSLALAQEQEQEVIQISVADLIRAFDENRVAAKRNYEGRTLEISGVIHEIIEVSRGVEVAVESPNRGLFEPTVRCLFSEDNIEQIMPLKEGQHVVLRGLFVGRGFFGDPRLRNCTTARETEQAPRVGSEEEFEEELERLRMETAEDVVPPPYELLEVSDVSFVSLGRGGSVRQLSYTIRLPGAYPEEQALRIAQFIVDDRHRQGNLVNAVSFFFYFPGTDPKGAADGSIDWASNGDWAEASNVRTGNYRTFRFETQVLWSPVKSVLFGQDFDRYLYIKVGFELSFKFFDYTLENLVAHWTRRVRPFAHRFKLFNKTLKNLAKNPRLEVPDLV